MDVGLLDAAVIDGPEPPDGAAEVSLDLTIDAPADRGPDLPGFREGGIHDQDAALTAATAVYLLGADPALLSLRQINTDGTGTPNPVAGFQGAVGFDPLATTAVRELVIGSQAVRPQVFARGALSGIRLPSDLGLLLYFHRKLTGTSGLVQVKIDGSVEVLLEVFGVYAEVLGDRVALATDGKLGAVVEAPNKVHLFRTDGLVLAGGGVSAELAAPVEVVEVRPPSLTFAGGWLHCIGVDQAGERSLLRAPVDGSGPLVPLPLSAPSAGAEPVHVADEMAVSDDATRLVLLAGEAPALTDVYALEAQTGAATRITVAPGDHAPRGDVLGEQSAKLAVSPDGSRVAFVRRTLGIDELYVGQTTGAPAIHVTASGRFADLVLRVANLVFADEDNLLFMAGKASNALDIYRWNHVQQQAVNLTRPQAGVPYDGSGNLRPRAAWISLPARTHLFLVVEYQDAVGRGLLAASLTSPFEVKEILPQGLGRVALSSSRFDRCAQSQQVFFVVQESSDQRAIWSFDEGTAGPATRVAGPPGPGPWVVDNLALDPACTRLLWTGGGSVDLQLLWSTPIDPLGPVQPLSTVPRSFGQPPIVTPDSATGVYVSGGGQGKTNLRAIPLPGGPITALDPAAGHVFLLGAF